MAKPLSPQEEIRPRGKEESKTSYRHNGRHREKHREEVEEVAGGRHTHFRGKREGMNHTFHASPPNQFPHKQYVLCFVESAALVGVGGGGGGGGRLY